MTTMRERLFCGVDPGASGAIAVIDGDSQICGIIKNTETPADLSAFVLSFQATHRLWAMIEQVSAMPKHGVSSTFKFGTSYGLLQGLLIAHGVCWQNVTPRIWQSEMRCLTKGNKNVTKAAAQQLWPQEKITHATADALLLAELCRRRALK
jgi:crossover junction endodeoxyribonuclease RuvC